MSEFRIEKVRHPVSVALADGSTVDGDLFLQPSARYRVGAQHPVELLNEPDAFVPLAVAGGDLLLVAKRQILRVEFAVNAADTEQEGAGSQGEGDARVEILFPDGSRSTGLLRLETRADRPRLLDFLNDDHEHFLMLRSPDRMILINRRQIVQVRQQR